MENNQDLKRANLISLIIVAAMIIIAIILALVIRSNNDRFRIINFDQIQTSLSSSNKEKIEKEIIAKLQENHDIESIAPGVEALIRVSSYEEQEITDGKEYNFLVDIDAYKMTYSINFAVTKNKSNSLIIDCPSIKDVKYPDSDCAGGNSSIADIERYLPYYLELADKRIATITSEYSNEKKDYLKVVISNCNNRFDTQITMDAVYEWISSLGYNPANFKIEISEYCDVSVNLPQRSTYVF